MAISRACIIKRVRPQDTTTKALKSPNFAKFARLNFVQSLGSVWNVKLSRYKCHVLYASRDL